MLMLSEIPRPAVSVEPVTEPVTIHEAKRHLNLAVADTAHDVYILSKIGSAREQFEHDTGMHFINRSMTLKLEYLCELQFPHTPVGSITSITYFDSGNSSQTLSSSVYTLDTARSQLRLGYLQVWPTTSDRYDAVTITYVLGSHTDSTTVPSYAKSAMLLLIANEFEQREMMGPGYKQDQRAYERLVAKFMRSTYP